MPTITKDEREEKRGREEEGEAGKPWQEEEGTIVLILLGGKRGCVESSITMLGLQIETSEATGAQTQDADSLSASRSFFFPKEN